MLFSKSWCGDFISDKCTPLVPVRAPSVKPIPPKPSLFHRAAANLHHAFTGWLLPPADAVVLATGPGNEIDAL